MRIANVTAAVLASAVLLGCASSKVVVPELPTLEYTNTSPKLKRVWQYNVGKQTPHLRFGFGLATLDQALFLSNEQGDVVAIDVATGRELWKISLSSGATAGPVVVGDALVVPNQEGVVALRASDGTTIWQAPLNAEVIAPAAGNAQVIAVRSVDGRLIGLNPQTGEKQWEVSREPLPLNVRGTSSPVLTNDLVVAGFDDGWLMAVQATTGEKRWEQRLALASGTNDLERLSDIDGTPTLDGDALYASSFGQRVVEVAASTGRGIWSYDASSLHPIVVDSGDVVFTTPEGTVVRLDKRTGKERFTQTKLQGRELGGPAVLNKFILFGDMEGHVHVLNADNGFLVARASFGADPILRSPLVIDDTAYVLTSSGSLHAVTIVTDAP